MRLDSVIDPELEFAEAHETLRKGRGGPWASFDLITLLVFVLQTD